MVKIKKFFEEARANFNVDDIFTDQSKILFILESPHKEELKHGVPLAGLSGRSMAKELFLEQTIEPMGKYLSQLIKDKGQSVYGIVNVAPFPLQRSAYPDSDFVHEFLKELQIAEAIRISTAKTFQDPEKALLHSLLINDFQNRLIKAVKNDTIIVPCGRFAGKYVDNLSIKDELNILEGVPHPSYNSWARPRYKDVIDIVREEGTKRTS